MSELSEEYLAWRRQQARIARQTPDRQSMTHASPRPEALAPEARVPMPFRFMGERYETPLRIPESNAEAAERTSQMMLPQGPGDIALGVALGPMAKMGTGILSTLARGAVGGAGLSMNPERAEAMFLGIKARRPPMSALKQAEIMRQKGAPPGWIHEDTQIHYGTDGHPRWEMDDSPVASDRRALRLPKEDRGPRPAEDVLNYPELWSQYPDIGRNVGIEVRRLNGPEAVWDPYQRVISVSPMAGNPKSSVMHELQHVVQDVEGWNGGTSREGLQTWLHEGHMQRMRQLERSTGNPRPDLSPEEQREYLTLRSELNKAFEPSRSYRDYLRSAGETESRNTQTRLNWDEWERGQTPPWSSADVAPPRQILHPSILDMSQQMQDWRLMGMPQPDRDRLIAYAREIGQTDEPLKRKP